MRKKTFLFITGFIIVGAIMTNFLSAENETIVKQDEVELNILNIEQWGDNSYYLTAEITNDSSFDLEDNHIFINEAYNFSDDHNQATSSSTNDHSSSATEHANEQKETNVEIEIDELHGTFNQVLANNSVQIGVRFEFLEDEYETILLIFRNDTIRNNNNVTKTHFTTLIEAVSLNEIK